MKYTQKELENMLAEFRACPAEPPWLDFKTGLKDPVQIAKYISGLANVAAYAGSTHGYLVWGVQDGTHTLVGTDFDPDVVLAEKKQPLRLWLRLVVKPQIQYEFYTFEIEGMKVVMLEVEAAYRQPVTFKGCAYVRIGSALTELSKTPKIAESIYRTVGHDWSAELVRGEGLDALDPDALAYAKQEFSLKHKGERCIEDMSEWDDITFLNKARLAIDGELTRACVLLLGKPEKAHLVRPAFARITWHLMDGEGNTLDFHHFGLPFLTGARDALAKIRSIMLRIMPEGAFMPVEIAQYDAWVLREALHNCIAHQDYEKRCDIVISEFPDRVVFANAGEFRPGSVEKAVFSNSRPRDYPNQQLIDAMVELNMIDTLGSGIRRMFMTQKKNFMPMPDYDLSDNEVKATVVGKVLDERFTRALIKKTDLPLDCVVALDAIQKGRKINRDMAVRLRKLGLVEGRFPHLFIASRLAAQADRVEDYLDSKGYDDTFYMQKVLEYICLKGKATRTQINGLIMKHLPNTLADAQKRTKVGNLLSLKMKKRFGWIDNVGNDRKSMWILTDRGVSECKRKNPNCKRTCKRSESGK